MPELFDPKPVVKHLTAAADHLRQAAEAAGTAVPVERIQSILVGATRAEALRHLVEGDAKHPRPKVRFP